MSTSHRPTPPPPRRPPGESPWGAATGQRSESPWGATSRSSGGERVTSRLRRVVEGLPDWEPLPPGETVVRRPGSAP
ncbi:hypothetical protein AB0D78_17095 [Streptomyces avermitilis]|uniref:hypothetical protein n=1 Tax=Streptomyces avermitilis TaxID=33903 RepID=UPI0033BDDBB0